MKPGLMFYSFLYPAVVDCLAYNESSRLWQLNNDR
jgi:hypothetical protein